VNSKTLGGRTALMEAAAVDGEIEVRKWYQLLWEQLRYQLFGKRWISKDLHGIRTPEAVKLLLQNGADVNAKDKDRLTPLKRAQIKVSRDSAEIVELLKAHGAKE